VVVAHSRSEGLCDIANSGAIGRFNFRGRRTVSFVRSWCLVQDVR